MASNTNQTEQKTQTAEELAAQTTGAKDTETKTAAPETKMVRIKLPKTKENQADVYVSVNHRSYQIQRGKVVDVPDFVAEVLQHQEEMQMEAMAFEAEHQQQEAK